LLLAALVGLCPLAAAALSASVELGAVELPGFGARQVQAELRWDAQDRLRLTLTVGELQTGEHRYANLQLQCDEAEWTEQRLWCDQGTLLSVAGETKQVLASPIKIEYRLDSGEFRIDAPQTTFAGGTADLRIAGTFEAWQATLVAHAVKAAELEPLLAVFELWPEGYGSVAGTLDFNTEVTVDRRGLATATLEADSKGLSFSGTHIADNADAHLQATLTSNADELNLEGAVNLIGGAVYIEPGFTIDEYRPGMTFEVAGEPVVFKWTARFDPASRLLHLDHVQLDQPHVASVAVTGKIPLAVQQSSLELRVEAKDTELKEFYSSHVKPHCAHLPALCGLEFEGSLQGAVEWDHSGIRDLSLKFQDVFMDDDRKRFRIAGLNGNLILSSSGAPVSSELHWQNAGWHRLHFGGGNMAMESRDRTLAVTRWSDVEVLGGMFKVESLELADVGTRDFAITMAGVLTPISVQDFCQAMGWPIMSGTLSGVIPGLSYHKGTLSLQGDLLVRAFGGNVVVRGLNIENAFGQSPELVTDIEIRNIDLEQLTGAFSFGKIEGTLEGAIHQLRLENWSPTAFDAYLETPVGDQRPHRISQKAVDNLSAIGGGGITGALSRGFLRIFQDYSYDRLGIRCRLENGVCAMAGIAPASDGFYIVSRGGILPLWIAVKGSGRRLPDGRFGIAWDDILLGLKRINSGQMKLQ